MKKNLIQLFMFAATMLTATALTGCGEEVIDNGGEDTSEKSPAGQTVFSCGDDDLTRTSINNKRAFFWGVGDKIWVKANGGNISGYIKSTGSSIAAPNTPTAKFVIPLPNRYFPDNTQLSYTGYANGDTTTTQYNRVTVADVQTQTAWNDGSHLGASGDCGTATAFKQDDGSFRFTVEHKASYLLFYPYLHTDLTGDYTLQKIEVYSDLSASNIAGTFDFDFANGLLDSDGTTKTPLNDSGKLEITLNCGNLAAGEFGLPKTAPVLSDVNNAAPHCFMVIAPGTHQLTIRYTAKKSDGTKFSFIKDIALKQYKPNGVYTFVHELRYSEVDYGFEFNEANTFYRWGRTYDYFGTEADDYDTRTTTITDGFWSTIPTNGIARKYLGDTDNLYYDNATRWKYNRRDGTVEKRYGGWWLKKIDYCTGELAWMKDCVIGRPSVGEMEHYFFLPEMSWTGNVKSEVIWWLSTAENS
ncbi:MAG: hypothetical protein IKZ83_03020, partial [Prevotella sp.]|nr:hypothetical protein [Prevotella sp.]